MIQKGLVTAIIFYNLIFASPNSFYNDLKRGWYYYENPPQEQEQEQELKKLLDMDEKEFMQSIPLESLDSLSVKEYTQIFDRVKEIATMKPTKEHVMTLQIMNKWQSEQSERFAKVWTINLLEYPNLEFPEISSDKFGRNQLLNQERKETEKFFRNKQDRLAFVVFYSKEKNKDTYQNQKAVYDLIEKDYGIKTEFVNLDDNLSLINRFKLQSFPENFFVYKNKNGEAIWHRIKAGYITRDTIINNTKFLFENVILEQDK